jgi:hypothetical protein
VRIEPAECTLNAHVLKIDDAMLISRRICSFDQAASSMRTGAVQYSETSYVHFLILPHACIRLSKKGIESLPTAQQLRGTARESV